MPIRHCEKCGLKVLIDESQLTSNPFYCQRCAALLESGTKKVEEEEPAEVEPAKSGPLKLVCPYCKATFSGRAPGKPAKGNCPVCRKELVLLPNGEIKPATVFDPSATVKDEEEEPSTADQIAAAKRAMEKVHSEKTGPPAAKPAPKPVTVPKADPKPVAATKPPPIAKPESKPPPRPVPPKPAPIARPATVPPPPRIPALGEPGIGKMVLAALILLLPLGAGGAFWHLREGKLKAVMEKLGAFGAKGLKKVYSKIRKEEPPAPTSSVPPPLASRPSERPAIDGPSAPESRSGCAANPSGPTRG